YARRGDWRQCRANLDEARQRRGEGDPHDWLLAAQAEHQAGNGPRAQAHLARARDWLKDVEREAVKRKLARRGQFLLLTCGQPLELVVVLRAEARLWGRPFVPLPPPTLRVPAQPLHN